MDTHTSGETRLIDLHCDTLTECAKRGLGLGDNSLHFSLGKIPPSYRICQAIAVFLPDELRGPAATDYFDQVYGVYRRQLEEYGGRLCPVTDTALIDRALDERPVALLLTVEGGAVLAGDLCQLDRIFSMGVRMMTLTWNGENEICGGAATDLGFTAFGRKVVGRMEQLGMAVDVSHLSDRGFYELCEFANSPFVASHSNARAVCDHPRNLTDEMFRIICKRGGIVGLNYYTHFIAKGGNTRSMEDLLRHVHHFLALGGERTLALGSDFDGADLPSYLNSVAGLDRLAQALLRSGIPEATVKNILYRNALGYFTRLSAHSTGACAAL